MAGRPRKHQEETKQEEHNDSAELPENPILQTEIVDSESIPPQSKDSDHTNAISTEDGWIKIGGLIHTQPPRNGFPLYVSKSPTEIGYLVFWKKTRAFANATRAWEITGKWIDCMSGLAIEFEPKYWKPRNV